MSIAQIGVKACLLGIRRLHFLKLRGKGIEVMGNGELASSALGSLSQVLMQEGQISEEQMNLALAKQKESGKFIGEILMEEGIIDEKSFISFLAKHCKIPHLSLLDYLIDAEILQLLPRDVCIQYRVIPIDKLGKNLTVAMVNPLDTNALKKVQEYCPDLRLKPILCAYNHFEQVVKKVFSDGEPKAQREMSMSSFGFRLHSPDDPPEETPQTPGAQDTAAQPKPAAPLSNSGIRAVTPTIGGRRRISGEATLFGAAAPKASVESKATPPTAETQAETQEKAKKEDTIFGEVFHKDEPANADAQVKPEGATGAPKPLTESSLGGLLGGAASSLMQEMANVMMNSMRETYAMLARRMELFNGVDSEEVARIFSRGIMAEYDEGEVIFNKGDHGDRLYLILSGDVEIVDGEKVLATLGRGDMFGEMALVSNEPRSATAVVLGSSSMLALSMDTIKHQMAPEVSFQILVNIIVTLSARIRKTNAMLQG